VVVKFLTLGGHSTKKSSACIYQVLALVKYTCINEEIFLLGTYGSLYSIHVIIAEKLKDTKCLLVDCFH
jgi:hypothetical protein